MRERRQGRTIVIVVAVIALLTSLIFLGNIFAQPEGGPPAGEMEPGAPGPGMEGEMGMGMGMPGGGGGGGAEGIAWTEEDMDEDLEMTYDEFLDRTGRQPAMIPDNFLYTEEDEAKENTENQWMQLQRVYSRREGPAAEAGVAGKPGYGLTTRIQREIAVKEAEIADVRYLYEKGLNNFSFEIGYPQVEHSAIRPGTTSVPIQVGVIMKVKPGVAQRYPSLVYRKLKKYDFYGEDRQIFRIHDYEGGIWNPKEIYLYNQAASEWSSLWGQNSVQLTLYDAAGDQVVSGTQSAGHGAGILADLLHPDELDYQPRHETRIPPRDKSFEGGNLNLTGKKGWYFSFSFTVPLSDLSGLDRAEAVLIGAGGIEGSSGQTQAPPPEQTNEFSGSRASMQSGGEEATGRARRGVAMSGAQIPPTTFTPGF